MVTLYLQKDLIIVICKNRIYEMIKLIIFDLGKVILDFSQRDIARGLATFSTLTKYQDPAKIMDHMFNNGSKIINLYEEGKITTDDFFSYFKESFGLNISFPRFKKIWNEIFKENDGIDMLIERFKKDFMLFLLSNTNELHFEYVKEEYPVIHKFDRWVVSYEAGVRKPEPEIFQIALNKAGVKPNETIFIDDIRENVKGAESIGINSVEFESVNQITTYIEERIYESRQ